MGKHFFIIILIILPIITHAQIAAYSADDIIHRASSKDTVYIINFWATWCAPCVGELPEFNLLESKYDKKQVKVLLVSLDFKGDNTYKLASFLQRKNITSEVVWLSDTDPNKFIPKIDNSWEGSIPATVIVAPGKNFKTFIEGTITEQQVSKIVDKVMSN